jgi:hypothetical protein
MSCQYKNRRVGLTALSSIVSPLQELNSKLLQQWFPTCSSQTHWDARNNSGNSQISTLWCSLINEVVILLWCLRGWKIENMALLFVLLFLAYFPKEASHSLYAISVSLCSPPTLLKVWKNIWNLLCIAQFISTAYFITVSHHSLSVCLLLLSSP